MAIGSEGHSYGYKYLSDFIAPYSGTYYISPGWSAGHYDDWVSLSIDEDVDTIGIPQGKPITGTSANDSLFAGVGNNIVDGRAGIDTYYLLGRREDYFISRSGDVVTTIDKVGIDGVDTIKNVERLKFKDVMVSFEIDGIAGQMYRLYQAAFNRVPDKDGLGYWVKAMERGMKVDQVAANFISSLEFQRLYGSSPPASTLLTKLYDNILHRPADPAGFAWWLDKMNSGATSPVDVLMAFSESAENRAQVIGSIQNGMEFTY